MTDTQTVAVAVDFSTRALEIAEELTRGNEYDTEGQKWAESRAADIRRVYNILCGRSADNNSPARPGGASVLGR